MYKSKDLKYITVRYECSDELAEQICVDFDIEANNNSFLSINSLLTDDYSQFVNFDSFFKPKYKKLILVNFINIRHIYSVKMFNLWMKCVDMFDEIYDTHQQIEEYRPHIQPKVKFYEITKNEEIETVFLTIQHQRPDMLTPSVEFRENIKDHTNFQPSTLKGLWYSKTPGTENLKTGRFCSFGEDVKLILNRNHNTKLITTHFLNYKYNRKSNFDVMMFKGDIVLENDVWVGRNATILPNVHIGNGAVIATEAVVTKDVPPYAIVAGNPAKIVKYRFTKKQIKALLKIKWWDWPLYQVYDNIDLLDSDNVDELIKKFGKKK